MKGTGVQHLLDRLIEALASDLPPGIQTVRTWVGAAGGLQIWPVPGSISAATDYGFGGIGEDTSPR